jgi:hypothetical protein
MENSICQKCGQIKETFDSWCLDCLYNEYGNDIE